MIIKAPSTHKWLAVSFPRGKGWKWDEGLWSWCIYFYIGLTRRSICRLCFTASVRGPVLWTDVTCFAGDMTESGAYFSICFAFRHLSPHNSHCQYLSCVWHSLCRVLERECESLLLSNTRERRIYTSFRKHKSYCWVNTQLLFFLGTVPRWHRRGHAYALKRHSTDVHVNVY